MGRLQLIRRYLLGVVVAFGLGLASSSLLADAICRVSINGVCQGTSSVGSLTTQISWATGLGAISQILGPSDQQLQISSAGSRALFINAGLGAIVSIGNNGNTYWNVGANGGLYPTSSADKGAATVASKGYYMDQTLMFGGAAPSVSSGFGTSPAMVNTNGSVAFEFNVGTGGTATSGVFSAGNTASHGWRINCDDITTQSATVFVTKQIATTTTTATVANFNTSGVQAAWAASDHLVCSLAGY